jgi:hypothetical protein
MMRTLHAVPTTWVQPTKLTTGMRGSRSPVTAQREPTWKGLLAISASGIASASWV